MFTDDSNVPSQIDEDVLADQNITDDMNVSLAGQENLVNDAETVANSLEITKRHQDSNQATEESDNEALFEIANEPKDNQASVPILGITVVLNITVIKGKLIYKYIYLKKLYILYMQHYLSLCTYKYMFTTYTGDKDKTEFGIVQNFKSQQESQVISDADMNDVTLDQGW